MLQLKYSTKRGRACKDGSGVEKQKQKMDAGLQFAISVDFSGAARTSQGWHPHRGEIKTAESWGSMITGRGPSGN